MKVLRRHSPHCEFASIAHNTIKRTPRRVPISNMLSLPSCEQVSRDEWNGFESRDDVGGTTCTSVNFQGLSRSDS